MPVSLSALPAPVRVSESRFPVRFRVNRHATQLACERLGVSAPVVVQFAVYKRRRGPSGTYIRTANGSHAVTIAYWLSAAEASRTLWHELTHAAQDERGATFENTSPRRDLAGYMNDPLEIEARANEHEHIHLSLCD